MRTLRFVLLLTVLAAAIGCARPSRYYSERRAYLGVQLKDISHSMKERLKLSTDKGAYVDQVVEDSPADKAGIKEEDVIVRFDGKTIEDSDDLITAVHRTPPKTDVKIDLVRNSEKKTLTATLGRVRAPEAFSFRMPSMPSLPRRPFQFHFYSSNSSYGLELESLSSQLSDYFEASGLLVASVESGSRADKAGFKAGDVVTKVNGHKIHEMSDFHDELSESRDSVAQIEVVRKGKTLTLSMKVPSEEDDDYSITIPRHEHSMKGRLERLRERINSLEERIREKIGRIQSSLKSRLFSL